jgi:hypothetical protein
MNLDNPEQVLSAKVYYWMREHVGEYETSTELAEAAAEEFDLNHEGGPLDDEHHWIWERALEAQED